MNFTNTSSQGGSFALWLNKQEKMYLSFDFIGVPRIVYCWNQHLISLTAQLAASFFKSTMQLHATCLLQAVIVKPATRMFTWQFPIDLFSTSLSKRPDINLLASCNHLHQNSCNLCRVATTCIRLPATCAVKAVLKHYKVDQNHRGFVQFILVLIALFLIAHLKARL